MVEALRMPRNKKLTPSTPHVFCLECTGAWTQAAALDSYGSGGGGTSSAQPTALTEQNSKQP